MNNKFRSGDVPKVAMYIQGDLGGAWFSHHIKDIKEGRCPLPCIVTKGTKEIETADAVLIHMRSLTNNEQLLQHLGIRDLSQPWVMFEVETELLANAIRHINYRSLNGLFNRTMYFRRDSDIILQHGFVVSAKDAGLLPPEWVKPHVITQDNFAKRRLAVAFISHCNDDSGRLQYIHAMEKYAGSDNWGDNGIDLYGNCGTLKCGSRLYASRNYMPDTDPCLIMAGNTYLFYLAFENARCEDYVTEKLYNLLFYPVVPVVLGAMEYSQILPPGSYIDASLYQPQQLVDRLRHLATHPKEYALYLEWRHDYRPSTVAGNRVFCHLCVRLHDPRFYQHKVIKDFRSWFVDRSNCNRNGTVRNRRLN